jgi:hypothetical protein
MDLIIRNGAIVTVGDNYQADIGIEVIKVNHTGNFLYPQTGRQGAYYLGSGYETKGTQTLWQEVAPGQKQSQSL